MPGKTEQLVQKVIVVADLWHYRDIAKDLDKQVGGRGVALVNGQIQSFIDSALQTAGINPGTVPGKFTGDGKILAFETAESACRFAEALHHTADFHNITRPVLLHRRHFRIGICAGEIVLEQQMNGGEVTGYEFSGLAIADASRLEGACQTGEILICPMTCERLPPPMRLAFGKRQRVAIKGDDVVEVYRRKVVDPVPDSNPPARPAGAIPHASGPLDEAIADGIAGVDAVVRQLAQARSSLTLDNVQEILSVAISHGAGIYNDGSPEGCARIYLHAAGRIIEQLPEAAVHQPFPKGSALAAEWLSRIVTENPGVDETIADDLAWELRFAFDSIQQIPLLDSIGAAITEARTLAGQPKPEVIATIIQKAMAVGRQIRRGQPHVSAYLVRHTAIVILRVFEKSPGGTKARPPAVDEWIKKVSPVVAAHPRITRQNAALLADEFPELLESF